MDNFGTTTKTGVKTSTKVIVGFLALGSIVAGVVLFKNKSKLFAPTIFPPTTTTPTNLPCNDSDGGIRIDIAGVTSLQDQNGVPVTSNADYCLSKEEVKEYYCGTKFSIASVNSLCPAATTRCLDGRCIPLTAPTTTPPTPTTTPPTPTTTPTLTCNDSLDGGANIFVYGVTYLKDANGVNVVSRPDYCVANGTVNGAVRENYCDSAGNLASSTTACPSSNICSGGRCLIPTSTPTPTTTPTASTSARVNITIYSDATTLSKIYGPSQVGVQLGKWKFATQNEGVTVRKLSLQTVNPAGGALLFNLNTFSSLSLYDGAILLATGNYVQGEVEFSGFASNIPADSMKIYTLKGSINPSGVMTRNIPTSFVISSDDIGDMEIASAGGSVLGTNNINYNLFSSNGVPESRFARSTVYIFHDAFPIMSALSVGNSISLESRAKIFKFNITNGGTRDLRVDRTIVSVSVSGLFAGESISDFRLYEDNGAGGILDTVYSQYNTVIQATTTNPVRIVFDKFVPAVNLLDDLVVAPGATKTFIVTANTTNMVLPGHIPGMISLSAKIVGSVGWNGATWNTGDLFCYYVPANNNNVELGPFSGSDYYDVQGGILSYSI